MDTQTNQTDENVVEVAEETTTDEVEVESTETVDVGESDETTATTTEPLKTDYKAKLESLTKKIAGDAFRYRKDKRQVETTEPENGLDEDDNRPLTRAEMQKILDEREQKILRQSSSKEAFAFARTLVDNDDEAKYAAAIWEHVTLPFDTVEEQMKFIVGGMNVDRLLAQKGELIRTVQSKTMARKNTATTARDAQAGNTPKIDPQVKQALENTGHKYDTTAKAWVKTLANGKKMFNDGRGKKWFE